MSDGEVWLGMLVKQKQELIAEFLEALHLLKMQIIDENLKRNVNGQTHIEYNDHFNIEIEKWEKRK